MAQIIGASYSMTNNSQNNSIIVRKIFSDGTSGYVKTVSTNGKGSTLTNTDPLFSQGSLACYQNYLFAVNAGSNSVAMFRINQNSPTDIQLIANAATVGEYPVSIAVNNSLVAVLTSGKNHGINFYSWNSTSLTHLPDNDRSIDIPNSSNSTPPDGPRNTVSEILFSPDNKSVIVSYKGSSVISPGSILIYTIDGNKVATSPVKNTYQGAALPFSMSLVGSNGLLVTDAAQGFATFSYNSTDGSSNAESRQVTIVPGETARALCWSTYSKQTGNYYLIGAASNNFLEVNLDSQLNGTIIKSYQVDSGITDANVFTVNNQDYLYINSPESRNVIVYKLNSSGNAELLQIDNTLPSSVEATGISGMVFYSQQQSYSWLWILLIIILIIILIWAWRYYLI